MIQAQRDYFGSHSYQKISGLNRHQTRREHGLAIAVSEWLGFSPGWLSATHPLSFTQSEQL